ncbi:TLP18.3/Psb32/MOLO-1 phosphatase superfamily protein [Pseudoduganella lurida]|uniref:TLP18.3/Psb32/MOLO-1 phosphatase superfamily protein n=1 Tax=Pseudoduganella lurida TaxID=1036180 RepID=A0A562R8G5_9BURK|nr:TPM domain-containing protein [Pseudoduganella lurida]TWI65368.1 TLP18.3/Psb32/MOLO-1 phosphatase superfamily protein [Pseudoduganella lurida]
MTDFSTRARRAWRHLSTGAGTGKRCFPQATLEAIAAAIAEGETRHRAEVRLIVEPALPFGAAWGGVGNRDRARALFAHYGIWDTEENCGVLIYVNLADHAVDIVADRNVGRLITEGEWQAVCATMTAAYKRGDFREGSVAALRQLADLLQRHFPADGARPNQLSNEAIIL